MIQVHALLRRVLPLVLLSLGANTTAQAALRIWVVPIVNQGQFVATMLAPFSAAQKVRVDITAIRGREVVAAARDGRADLIITHADFMTVAALVQDDLIGRGSVVFANPIALLAPRADPAHVATARSPEEALARIRTSKACLINNDLEHLREFAPVESSPACAEASTGQAGIGAVLTAQSKDAYVWWGLHPFLNTEVALTPVVLPDPRILRPLMAWAVRGDQMQLAEAAVEALRSPAAQSAIASFRLAGHPETQVWWSHTALDRLAAIRARGRLIVAVKNAGSRSTAEHRDPAHIAKRDFEIRLAGAIAKRLLGDVDKLEVEMMRKPQRLPAIAGGQVDLGISMLPPNRKGQSYVDFSHPYFEDGLAVMHDPQVEIENAQALPGKRWLTLARDPVGQEDERREIEAAVGSPLTTTPTPNFRAAAAMIEAGEADGLISLAANIDAFLAGYTSDLRRSPILRGTRYAVAIPKDNPTLRAVVNETIEDLARSGTLREWRQATRLAR
ncbi:MAG: transporter substrate-binding domain-containing protein [Gammaproteobacteria bacterium]